MLNSLRTHPYLFSLLVALITAILVWLYVRTLETDKDKVNKTFNITLAAGIIAAVGLTWLVHRDVEPLACEPFIQE